ncbi:unnamed protein product [Ceutorhynchus assimilis]|uniref:C2H2-type domain-containing protein n=1 Tax=Ceutorhynchus assimilis TaxID=467358 RepID=A0A9N9MN14_9CUCU|nr:unnamed protein product [Ceutorhynchus assimilis]
MKIVQMAGTTNRSHNSSSSSSDPIWATDVELLPSEECLPIIGSCQVTSILQNLDSTHNDQNLQNMDLIILNPSDYKLPLEAPLNLHTSSYIVLKDSSVTLEACSNANSTTQQHEKQSNNTKNYTMEDPKNLEPTDLSLNIADTSNSSNTSSNLISPNPKHYDKESFEDMLYFVCNLCPFLCTKETQITEHLESVHKNKTVSKLVQMKCPACANIFYHRASLKSHLLHDHCVANNDLNLIVQAVMFYSNKENKKEENKKLNNDAKALKNKDKVVVEKTAGKAVESNSSKNNVTQCKSQNKDVIDLIKPVNSDSIETLPGSSTQQINELETVVANPEPVPEKIPLPQVDITTNNSEELITNLMKKSDALVKYMNSQKCPFAFCKVLMSDSKKMDYHIESHCYEGFKCVECQEIFMSWKTLMTHLWRSHKVDMELFGCDKCDYKTPSLSKLNTVHKLIHSNVKAFQCDICEKMFKNQKQVRNHRRIHRQNVVKETETCELCPRTFTDKRSLRSHMDSVHKKLKPFLCNYCDYKGSCKTSLKMHIRCHTGEKPFSCDQCEYVTADHNSLRRHKLRHTGHKPYKCSYCSYACIQSSTYKVHLKTKHPGLEKDHMFSCSLCQFRTVNKELFNSHSHSVSLQEQKVVGS